MEAQTFFDDRDLDFMPTAVPGLRILVSNYRSQLPREQFDQLMNDIRAGYEHYKRLLSQYPAGPQRAMAMHRLMNREIEAVSNVEPTCYKGCGSCCHLEVEVTRDEARLLAGVVRAGHSIDHARLRLQAARERRSPDWAPMIKAENRCVFLDQSNSCSVYDFRPSICRKHLVTSPPEDCVTDGKPLSGSGPGTQTRLPVVILIPYGDILLSAALALPDNPRNTLSKSLKAALDADVGAELYGGAQFQGPGQQSGQSITNWPPSVGTAE